MRLKSLLSVFLIFGVLNSTACAETWQEFRKNPILSIQNKVGVLRTALSFASTAFEIWAGLNPTIAAETRSQFLHLIAKVDQGIKVAQDGLQIAGSVQQGSTDPNTLFQGAQTAIADVNTFLAGLTTGSHGAMDPVFLQALQVTDEAAHMH